jgi:transposase
MKELLTVLDEDIEYVSSELIGDAIEIKIESRRDMGTCPYCGKTSEKIHSHYTRILQDLPIQGKKVRLVLNNRKYFCLNKKCTHKTFAETFNFFEPKATATKRLKEEIVQVAITQSSVSAANYLNKNVARVGKSTICTLLKKKKKME